MTPPRSLSPAGPLSIGDPVSFGLFDGRQVPCTVAEIDGKTRLPSVLKVTETIPHRCKADARITLDPLFWEGFAR